MLTPKDVQWIGGGAVDAIVWNGLEAGGEVEIVFLDVKVGRHVHLTDNQRRIREAIRWKKVAFDEYRPPETLPLTMAAPLSDDLDMPDLPDEDVPIMLAGTLGLPELEPSDDPDMPDLPDEDVPIMSPEKLGSPEAE